MACSQCRPIRLAVLWIAVLAAVGGCSRELSGEAMLIDGISRTVGFDLPADATILAYHHKHDHDDAPSRCSQLWIVRASSALAGPDHRTRQTRAKSPFASLAVLVKQATDGHVSIEAADKAACECVEWQHEKMMCRLRQARTRDGWIAALEAVSPE